jgi:Mg-chelatase subunit ChlD
MVDATASMTALNKPGQREALLSRLNAAGPAPTDVTPLYKSILAGYQELLKGYKPELRNTLVVFTDGRDNTGGTLRQAQRDLEILADVTRPIRVVLLGIGPEINLDELKAIAATTGGAAFQVNTPEEMQLIFLQALLS